VGQTFDDIDLHDAVGEQMKSPAGAACRWLRAGELGDPGLDIPGDFDRVRGCVAGLALERGERADFAAALPQALDRAGGEAGDAHDFGVLETGAVSPFVGKEEAEGVHGFPGLGSLALFRAVMVAYGFEFEAFFSGELDAM